MSHSTTKTAARHEKDPVREPAAASSPAPTNSPDCRGSMLTQQTKLASHTCRPLNGSSSRNTQDYHRDIVSYLKAWRPPVEYYARRRYHHPSLSYPSRSPSLPSLLEERITHDGDLDVVCPQSAMATSLRAYRKRIFPSHLSSNTSPPPPNLHLSAHSAWRDDESDEDLESDDDTDDADQAEHQSDEEDENITPRNSPPSTSTYFLQPLVLTKLPGYP
ncbi:hypothetical protein VP01_290g9 [Puccinia sorghi]|uniref:Uncharacterized protein n=1 Tax=Puccinia sorghi TaxID=27349 RepID=A0A0L6V1C2_9BASI|nr:hypothetical protein VP01_290g9 [Puccinia sorghi]